MRQTTPPEPPESRATRLRIKSPVLTSHNLTVPSSELVTTKRELNCRQVTADWCLFGPVNQSINQWVSKSFSSHWASNLPDSVCRHCPVVMSQTLTVESALPETSMFWRSSMPDVKLWWPISVCLQLPVSTSQTRIEVSSEPDTTCSPSNWNV